MFRVLGPGAEERTFLGYWLSGPDIGDYEEFPGDVDEWLDPVFYF